MEFQSRRLTFFLFHTGFHDKPYILMMILVEVGAGVQMSLRIVFALVLAVDSVSQ